VNRGRRLIQRALFATAALVVTVNLLAYLSEGDIPRRPVDGVAVEGLLAGGAFGALRPGDVRRLQRLLGPRDRFVLLGTHVATIYGDPRRNARLLLESMLLPSVMVESCRAATVVIALDASAGHCDVPVASKVVLPSGVTVYRTSE
jgi:hypothetical protein